ncbi:MAG: Tfp pilus assembly protein FimT/FimU [Limisphaerales bacterium]
MGVDRSRGRVAAGFTLIELIVVIVLMGILAAMIVPEMRGSHGEAVLRAGGRELANVCAMASSRAVSFGKVHRVLVDPATRRFRVERRVRGPDREPVFVPVREVAGCDGQLGEALSVQVRPAGTGSEVDPGETLSRGPPGEGIEAGLGAADDGVRGSADTGNRIPGQGLSFYPDGTADRREIVLRDRDGFGLVLRINPVTARVRILNLPRL